MGFSVAPVLRLIATPFVHSRPPFVIYFLTPFRMDLLCAGSLVALAWNFNGERLGRLRRFATGTAVAGVAVILALSLLPSFRTGANSPLFNTVGYSMSVVIFTSVLVATLYLKTGVIYEALTSKALGYVGRVSYTMYLVHEAMLSFARQATPHIWLQALGAFALTIGFATLSWYVVEAPLLRPTRRAATGAA